MDLFNEELAHVLVDLPDPFTVEYRQQALDEANYDQRIENTFPSSPPTVSKKSRKGPWMSSSPEADLHPDTTSITGKSERDTSTGLLTSLFTVNLLLGYS